MSYGPGPTSVGTFFANGNNGNTSLQADAMTIAGTCNCPDPGNPPDGGTPPGQGGGTCGGPQVQYLPQAGIGSSGFSGPMVTADSSRLPVVPPVKPHFPHPPFGPTDPCFYPELILGQSTGKPCGAIPPDAPSGLNNNCVAPSTRIALFPEGCLAAAEVQVGDLLLTHRVDGTLAGERVTAVRRTMQPRVVLETEDGRRLHCSLSHEVMAADPDLPQGRRIVVSELTLSDRLLLEDGTAVALTAIAREPDGAVVRISLSGPEHLYLSEGLWSHNKLAIQWPSGIIP
jgi:hypothetical protein